MNEKTKLEKLNQAFYQFNRASEILQEYYRSLREHVQHLTFELQKKNRELETTLGFLDSIIQSIDEAIVVLDNEKRIIMINKASEELFKIDHSEVKGENFEILGFPLDMNNRSCIVEDSDNERIFSVSVSQVKNKEDSAGYVLLIKDITAMKAKELEDNRNKRLIAMGEMMACIVHELRNPLCSIELYSSMLYRELKGTPYESIARGVSGGVQNLNNFLSNMLYFAKPRIPKKTLFRIDTLVEETLSMITPVIQTRSIIIEHTVESLYMEGDSGLIKQAVMNILLNAVQAIDSEGVIKIYTETKDGFFRLNIEDSGRGIERSIIDRIFDPFFSTKDGGTGLGLSISLRIMQSHGGSISIKSMTGEGTVFSLQFPERLIIKGVDSYVSNTYCR